MKSYNRKFRGIADKYHGMSNTTPFYNKLLMQHKNVVFDSLCELTNENTGGKARVVNVYI